MRFGQRRESMGLPSLHGAKHDRGDERRVGHVPGVAVQRAAASRLLQQDVGRDHPHGLDRDRVLGSQRGHGLQHCLLERSPRSVASRRSAQEPLGLASRCHHCRRRASFGLAWQRSGRSALGSIRSLRRGRTDHQVDRSGSKQTKLIYKMTSTPSLLNKYTYILLFFL